MQNAPQRNLLKLGAAALIALLFSVPLSPLHAQEADAQWSVRMAESVMARQPVLSDEWHYEVGLMLKAFEQLWKRTGDERYYDYLKRNMDGFIAEDGSIRTYEMEEFNMDQINAGKVLFPLYERTAEERYRRAADTLRQQLRLHPRTSEGGFWHKQIYPYQLWLDGVYMGGPFLTQYGIAFDDPEAIDEVTREILLVARYTRDPATGLFYHGWDEKREQVWADSVTGLSANFWGRAMGWYAMALVDVLDDLPEDHADYRAVVQVLQNLAEAVRNVQDPVTGLWYQVVDKPAHEGNYLEGSASSMFTYALAKGVRQGHLDARYLDVAKRAYDGLLSHLITVEDGLVSLNQICAVAGLGGKQQRDGSFEYYMSEPVVANDPKGVGPFIMASLEMERLGQAENP